MKVSLSFVSDAKDKDSEKMIFVIKNPKMDGRFIIILIPI